MRQAKLAIAAICALLMTLVEVGAQAKVPRICFLTLDPGSAQKPSKRHEPFFHALQQLGYVHGQSVTVDYNSAGSRGDDFPALTAECIRRGADIIVVTTTPAAFAAKAATSTIPIVMASLADPVRTGLVASLATPGGNITGMSNMGTELAAKRLALLKEAVPTIKRPLILTYLSDPIAALQVETLKEAAQVHGLSLVFQDIRSAADLPTAFENASREGADALLTVTASIFNIERALIADLAKRHRLPAMYPYRQNVTAGGLMAYHVDEADVLVRAAAYVDRLLKGAKPAELPVQQPTTFRLVVNAKTANALGLIFPPMMLVLADEVIE